MRAKVVALSPRPMLPQAGKLYVDPDGWVELQVSREEAARIAKLGDVKVELEVRAALPCPLCTFTVAYREVSGLYKCESDQCDWESADAPVGHL